MFFDQQVHFFTEISKRSTCTHLHSSELESGGQRHLKKAETFPIHALKQRVVKILQHYKWNCRKCRYFDKLTRICCVDYKTFALHVGRSLCLFLVILHLFSVSFWCTRWKLAKVVNSQSCSWSLSLPNNISLFTKTTNVCQHVYLTISCYWIQGICFNISHWVQIHFQIWSKPNTCINKWHTCYCFL